LWTVTQPSEELLREEGAREMSMERQVRGFEGDSLLVGQLPEGCRRCAQGSKMVLFVTGHCNSKCFYCPLSEEKAKKDIVFADEMPVKSDADILFEVNAIEADGAGISGGDPLCRLERTLKYIRLLKTQYGDDFHIHLYTSQANAPKEVLMKLMEAGLDEIRFHPQSKDWSGIETAVEMGMEVGIEIPVFPNQGEYIKEVATRAEKIGVSFLNINELESSETNFESLVRKGFRLRDTGTAAIEGSAELASEILEWSVGSLRKLSVHYCSARFKDAVQMRNRLERRLESTIREFEDRDELEPLLILGVIRAPHGKRLSSKQLEEIGAVLTDDFDVPENLMNLDFARMRIETAGWILDEIVEELREALDHGDELEIGLVFEYPSWDRLQILFDPL